jgi:Universal stress protein UspA and related nucleotide-binding proteins
MKVVFAYDGSDHAKKALVFGSGLLGENAEIHIVTVVREVPREPESEIIESEEKAKKLLQEAKDTVKAKQVVTEYLVSNSVADAVIDYCRQIGCDMIVTGSRGLSRIKKAILGSVSSELMAKSPVPVLVVK